MKYLETFLFKMRDFKVGDYVIIKNKNLININDNIFKIIEISTETIAKDTYILPYRLKSVLNGNIEYQPRSAIIRKLNPEEIEKIKIESDIKKYNL